MSPVVVCNCPLTEEECEDSGCDACPRLEIVVEEQPAIEEESEYLDPLWEEDFDWYDDEPLVEPIVEDRGIPFESCYEDGFEDWDPIPADLL